MARCATVHTHSENRILCQRTSNHRDTEVTGNKDGVVCGSGQASQPRSLLVCSHLGLLTLAVVPAVPGLGNQQRDEVALLEAQQSAVVAGRVGENGLDPHAAITFEASCHGARTWQRLVFSCRDNGCVRERLFASDGAGIQEFTTVRDQWKPPPPSSPSAADGALVSSHHAAVPINMHYMLAHA